MAFDLQRLLERQIEGKALPNHPALRGDTPASFYTPGQRPQRKQGEMSQREAKHHMQAYGGLEAIDWVANCIDLYADTTSSASYHLEKDGERLWTSKTPDTPKDAKFADERLVELLQQPNPFMDYIELMQLLVIDYMLVGNAYWYKYQMTEDGKPFALYRLSPLHVKVIPGPQGVQRYIYDPPGARKALPIAPEEILHFKRPNPHNPWYGLGVVKAGGRPLDLELALTDASAHYYENKADPSLIVQSERRVPRDVFKKLGQQLRARIGGRHNAGDLLVLEAGLKATTLTPNARDAMYREIANQSRDRLCAMFRVDPKLLGIHDQGGSSGDKVQDARREFDNKTMRPFLDKLQSRITHGLIAAWGYEYKIDYAYIMPQEEAVKLVSDFGSVPGVKVKEVRTFLFEAGLLKSISTGDPEIDEMVLNLPGEELDENGEGGFADRPLAREAGRPPNGENTRPFPRSGQALPARSRVRRPNSQKALPLEEAFEELQSVLEAAGAAESKAFEREGRTTVGNVLPDERRPQDTLAPFRTREVDALVSEMSQELTTHAMTLERGLLDHVEGKAFEPNTLVSRIRKSAAWQTFQGLLEDTLQRGATSAVASAVVQQGSEGVRPEDDLDYEAIAKGVIYRPDGVKGITDNLKQEIVQKVSDAVEKGKDRREVEAVIRESIDFWRQGHSETVAMTEAVHAYNEGTLAVFDSAGIENVLVYDGEDHDDACADANGRVWTIEQARERRLEHPRCRRAFIALESTE